MKFIINITLLFLVRIIVSFLIMLFSTISVKSQNNYVEVGKNYNSVKLMLNNYQTINAKNLILINDSIIHFENSLNGLKEVKHINDVKILSERNGSYALSYGLIGAGIGLTSVLFTQVLYDTEDVNWTSFYLGFTAGGAALGVIIGACIPKWKGLYFHNKSTAYHIQLTPNINTNFCGLGLKVNF
jgi:hypothetical protein